MELSLLGAAPGQANPDSAWSALSGCGSAEEWGRSVGDRTLLDGVLPAASLGCCRTLVSAAETQLHLYLMFASSSCHAVLGKPQCPPVPVPCVEESQALGRGQVREDSSCWEQGTEPCTWCPAAALAAGVERLTA